jgi:hypothetical protein
VSGLKKRYLSVERSCHDIVMLQWFSTAQLQCASPPMINIAEWRKLRSQQGRGSELAEGSSKCPLVTVLFMLKYGGISSLAGWFMR